MWWARSFVSSTYKHPLCELFFAKLCAQHLFKTKNKSDKFPCGRRKWYTNNIPHRSRQHGVPGYRQIKSTDFIRKIIVYVNTMRLQLAGISSDATDTVTMLWVLHNSILCSLLLTCRCHDRTQIITVYSSRAIKSQIQKYPSANWNTVIFATKFHC